MPSPFFILKPTLFFSTDYFKPQYMTLLRLQKISVDITQRLPLDKLCGALAALFWQITALRTRPSRACTARPAPPTAAPSARTAPALTQKAPGRSAVRGFLQGAT